MSSPSDLPPDSPRYDQRKDDLPESLLGVLGDALKPSELAQGQRDRMRSQVLERAQRATPEGTATWRAADTAWITISPMVEVRELFRDPRTRTHTSMMRVRPGGIIPPHRHEHVEEFIILEGDCQIGPHHLGPGDAHVAQPGSWHDAVTTRNGVLVLIKGEYPYPSESSGEPDARAGG